MIKHKNSTEDVFATLSACAKRIPGSIAIASQAGHVSYGDLLGHITSAASTALNKGIRPGQLVVITVENPDVSFTLALALMRIGCRVGYTPNLDLYRSKSVKVDAIVADASTADGVGVVAVTKDWFGGARAQKLSLPPASNEGSLIVSSSGSTGRPKLVERRAQVLYGEVSRRVRILKEFPYPRFLSTYHNRAISTFTDSVAALLLGGAAIRPIALRPNSILDAIQLFRPDYLLISPLMLNHLVLAFDSKPIAMRKIGLIRTGGAHCAPVLQRAALDRFTEKYISVYGAAEFGWIAAGYFDDLRTIEGATGRIVDGVEVAAFDEGGRRLPIGTEGVIRARAEIELPRYLGEDAVDQTAFSDGWFATGDVGFVDEKGYLFLRGRATNVINLGGNKISPEDMEACLLSHGSIEDAGVTGIDLAEGYQKIGAAMVSSVPLDLKDINAYLAETSKYWAIQVLKPVTSVPKTQNGKIDRVALKRLLAE